VKKAKILMVDDDREMCQEMLDVLAEEGYRVTIALDGLKAEEMLNEDGYDVILLDLKIPGASGFDILEKARRKDKGAKVIVVTGRPMASQVLIRDADKETAREENILKRADRVINKPFDVIELLQALKELTKD